MKAYSLIRPQPHYRSDAFAAGLEAAGYQVSRSGPTGKVSPDDVLLIWNRYFENERLADAFEAAGGRVLVAENGYLNKGGGNPKFDAHEGKPGYYALALGQHNGAGRWVEGDGSRWAALGIELKPMQDNAGGHTLVCPNRMFGSKVTMPPVDWFVRPIDDLMMAGAKIVIRSHPGNKRPASPLDGDLRGCRQMLIWGSSAGLYALLAGIPVTLHAPWWIGGGWLVDGEDRRQQVLERIANAQWTVEEISSGAPFIALLRSKIDGPNQRISADSALTTP